MPSYTQKTAELKQQADQLKEKIPSGLKFMPDVKAGLALQAEALELMQEMAISLDKFEGRTDG
jgi:hypothetical protein